jgi:ubiquinone/menaquinone biosynthesis C-methylase UbiE
MARHGFRVHALDFSQSALGMARDSVLAAGLSDRVTLLRADLLHLPFAAGQFDCVLCWGVIMHVAEPRTALAELARVLAPGGVLILGENNMRSLQSLAARVAGYVRPTGRSRRVERTVAGIETWKDTPDGPLLTRQTDIGWLRSVCRDNGLTLQKRMPGQFSELYRAASSIPLARAVHAMNALWFRAVRIPFGAFGNILVFRKERQPGQDP